MADRQLYAYFAPVSTRLRLQTHIFSQVVDCCIILPWACRGRCHVNLGVGDCAGYRHDDRAADQLQTPALSAADHRPCRLAVFSISSQPEAGRRIAARAGDRISPNSVNKQPEAGRAGRKRISSTVICSRKRLTGVCRKIRNYILDRLRAATLRRRNLFLRVAGHPHRENALV